MEKVKREFSLSKEIKAKKRENYLKRKSKMSVKKNCLYCGKEFLSYMRTIVLSTIYCSTSCGAKKQWSNKTKSMIKKNNNVENEDTKLLREYWQAFHDNLVTFKEVIDLKIMNERFVSNKAYDKYDLFIPDNLK